MVARNPITGDAIQTKGVSDAYRNHYDEIFRKKPMQVRVKDNGDDFGSCGCGRSPTGKCVGWHGLTEDAFKQRLEDYQTGKVDLGGNEVK